MTPLLLLTSVLLVLSGLIKIRSGARTGRGLPVVALLEIAVAVGAAGLAFSGPSAAGAAAWVVPAGVLLVVLSSASHVHHMSAHRRMREESLGDRLATHVKYPVGRGGESDPES